LAVEGIIRNARALNYLIEDLFDLARISSGKLRLNRTEMRLQEVVREALTAIQPAAENKKLRISTDISEAIPPFVADPRRLRQMIINLLNNAVKFTPGGGSIALKVVKRGQSVECVVSDSGKGIDHKFLPFVFDRFRQENRSQQSATMGLGLGLTIVREIAELHGGRVTAYSAGPNQGATFTVQLPIRLRRRI
jgi:signal transduction histidine kinase